MSTTEVTLTAGALAALKRLDAGQCLEREVDRSVLRWVGEGLDGKETLHHLTFRNLQSCGAVVSSREKKGFDIFRISPTGRELLPKST